MQQFKPVPTGEAYINKLGKAVAAKWAVIDVITGKEEMVGPQTDCIDMAGHLNVELPKRIAIDLLKADIEKPQLRG